MLKLGKNTKLQVHKNEAKVIIAKSQCKLHYINL